MGMLSLGISESQIVWVRLGLVQEKLYTLKICETG